MPSVSWSGVKLAAIGLWSSGNAFSGIMNYNNWFVNIDVEELDWLAQSPDLNPIKHLWDELERRLRASPNRPTSVSYNQLIAHETDA